MTHRICVSCRDRYEAQKLASLAYLRESGETFITEILDIIGSELVVSLRDKSAHSIVLRDPAQVEAFADFMQSITDGRHRITGTATRGTDVEMTKS